MFGLFKKDTPFVLTSKGRVAKLEEEDKETGYATISFGSFNPSEWVVKSRTTISIHEIRQRLTKGEAADALRKKFKK